MRTITTRARDGSALACRECSRPAYGPVPAEPLIVDVAQGVEYDARPFFTPGPSDVARIPPRLYPHRTKGSDVRLLELSLQPTKLARHAGSTLYTWSYPRLLFGQPVRLDVQGIAPIDRLGELTWLGPLSVLAFGLMVGLVVSAASIPRFDLWMLLLTLGTFAGAYPLMYFAQECIALGPAVLISAGFALTVIGVLAVTLMGVWLALGGVLLPATAILAVTLTAAVWPALQGILLTVEVLGFFIVAMLLLRTIRSTAIAPPAGGPEIPSAPDELA